MIISTMFDLGFYVGKDIIAVIYAYLDSGTYVVFRMSLYLNSIYMFRFDKSTS